MAGESRSVVVRLSLDTAQAIRASKEFGSEFGQAMDAAERRASKTRSSLDQITTSSGKLALVAGAGLAAVVATTANFDEAMSHVAATGDDARSSFDQLREAAIQAGQETAFSATEAAGGIENLAKAGVSAKDILGGGLKGSLDLAAAGGLDVADAAEIAASALTQFKLSGADVPHVADLLAAGAGKAQGSVQDLGYALKYAGVPAASLGISIEETTGTLAEFASAGIVGEQAGTTLRSMLLSLAAPTQKAQETMDQYGISLYDANGKFVGIQAAAEQLHTQLSGVSEAQRNAALSTIFGNNAIQGAIQLYNGGGQAVADWTAKVNDQGYAAKTAATRMDNLKGDVEQLKGALETAFIGSGEGSQGALRKLTQGATDLVNAFNKAPAPVQQTATALLGLVAVGAGGFWFTSKAVTTINDTRTALSELGVTSGRTGAALKVLGGLGSAATVLLAIEAAAAAAIRSTDKAAPGIEQLTESLLNLQSMAGLQGIAQDVGDLSGAIETLSDPGIAQNIGEIYDKVPLVGSAFADMAPGLRGARQDARDAATSIDALDQALAGIASNGSPEQARQTFADLAAAYHLTGDEQDKLLGLLPQYKEALAGSANAAQLNAGATDQMSVSQRQAAADAKALKDALAEERDAAQQTAASFLEFGDNLNDSKVSLSEWIRSMQEQADALRNFGENAADAARKGLDEGLIKSLEKAGPAGALRLKQLANASEAEIGRANKAFRSGQNELERFERTLGGLKPANLDLTDTEFRSKLNAAETSLRKYGLTRSQADLLVADLASGKIKTVQQLVNKYGLTKATAKALLNDLASGKLKAVLALLNDLDGKHAVSTIETIHLDSYRSKLGGTADPNPDARGADGMTVPGQRLPYGDKVLAYLAPGEEVISNRHGQADRFRADRAAGKIPAYADGGTAGRYASVGAGGTPYFPDVTTSAAHALADLANAGEKELKTRQKLLQNEVDRDKQQLDNLKQLKASLVQSVRDIIGGGDLFTVNDPTTPGGLTAPDGASQDYLDLLAQHNAQLAAQSGGSGVTSNLDSMLAEGRERLNLIKALHRMGVDGQALAYLATQPIEVLRELAGSKKEAHQFEHQYNQLQQLSQQAGQYVGSAVYDKRIDALAHQYKEHTAALHKIEHKLHKLDDIEKAVDEAANREVAALRGVANHAGRQQRGPH